MPQEIIVIECTFWGEDSLQTLPGNFYAGMSSYIKGGKTLAMERDESNSKPNQEVYDYHSQYAYIL